jgi:hypothetical protein
MIDIPGPWGPWLSAAILIFGTGGFWSLLSARAKSKAADVKAATADWQALNAYWQAEMAKMDARIHALEVKSQADENYIERLEFHIWSELPPPPPMRNTPTPPAPKDHP